MKRLSFIFIFLLCFIGFVGCDSGGGRVNPPAPIVNPNIAIVNDNILCLPERVTEDEFEFIEQTLELYNSLTEQEKAQIVGYDELLRCVDEMDTLKGVPLVLEDGFNEVIALIDALPDVVELEDDNINLFTSYSKLVNGRNYTYRINWNSDNKDAISNLGVIKHFKDDKIVTLTASIYLARLDKTVTHTKQILIEKKVGIVFDKQICVAYWYGSYSELTDTDYKTLDVINYSFAQIAKDDSGKWYISISNRGKEALASFQEVRERGIKVCISLGGWHDDKSFWNTYAEAARTEENRQAVAKAILDFLIEYDLDGVDMDWEYPTSSQRGNYTLLMKEIRKQLKYYNRDYLVTAAIPSGNWITSSFNLTDLKDTLDYFYIMTYDLDDGDECNHNSSLQDAIDAVAFYQNKGIETSKIVIGSAFYGRLYKGASSTNNGLNGPSTSKEEIEYHTIKEQYLSRLNNGVVKLYDEQNKAYYLYDSVNHEFITYEDTESVIAKWEYVVESGIGGLMFWQYNCDETNTLVGAIHTAQTAEK